MTFPMIATPGTNAPLSPQNAPRLPGATNTTDAGNSFGVLLDMGNVSQPKIAGSNGPALGVTLGGLNDPAAANVTITLPGSVPQQQIPASNIELNFETPEPAQLEPVTLDTAPMDGEAGANGSLTIKADALPSLAFAAAGETVERLTDSTQASLDSSEEASNEVGQNKPTTDENPQPVSSDNNRAKTSAEDKQRATEAPTIQVAAFDALATAEIAAKAAEQEPGQQVQPAEPATVVVPAAIVTPKAQPTAPDRKNLGSPNGAIQMAAGSGPESASTQPKPAGQASLASVSKPETAKAERVTSQPLTGGEEFAAELADAESPRIESARLASPSNSATGEMRGTSTATANAAEPSVCARAEQIGRDVGVEIARHVRKGQDEFSVRMDPAELGRIQIRLAFDDQGHLRAHVSADSQAAIELLRRDSGDLARALSDAGVRTDSQSFRFTGGEQSGMGGRQGQNEGNAAGQNAGQTNNETEIGDGEELAAYQNVQAAGRVDIMA